MTVQVKALACELPWELGLPLSRFSAAELAAEAIRRGIVAEISGTTIWRWLHEDAIKPWQHRCWIFPRDPQFEEKAGRVLDLYQGRWNGAPLGRAEFVVSADEKTSIQARRSIHRPQPPQPGQAARFEFEYDRCGALAYLAAWDVRRAKIFGCCERRSGIRPFGSLVDLVMSQEPYRSAQRVHWIVDNGSSHRGQPSIQRMLTKWPNTNLVHLPVHASWLNQIEIYFSIVQRKVLHPNDFNSLSALSDRILRFQEFFEKTAQPFEWKYTREDLKKTLHRLSSPTVQANVA